MSNCWICGIQNLAVSKFSKMSEKWWCYCGEFNVTRVWRWCALGNSLMPVSLMIACGSGVDGCILCCNSKYWRRVKPISTMTIGKMYKKGSCNLLDTQNLCIDGKIWLNLRICCYIFQLGSMKSFSFYEGDNPFHLQHVWEMIISGFSGIAD